MATDRRPGAAFNIGTTSASKISASGSGRRRPRLSFFCEGRREFFSKRSAVEVLNDAFAAATAGVSVRRNFMYSLIW
jgi:hypothetical protein